MNPPARASTIPSSIDSEVCFARSMYRHPSGAIPRVAHMTHAIVAHPKRMGAGDQSVVETFADPSPGPKAPVGEMSKGKVPHRLKAAMNIRMAFEGVVPTRCVAAAKAAFSSGSTFATTGVM